MERKNQTAHTISTRIGRFSQFSFDDYSLMTSKTVSYRQDSRNISRVMETDPSEKSFGAQKNERIK